MFGRKSLGGGGTGGGGEGTLLQEVRVLRKEEEEEEEQQQQQQQHAAYLVQFKPTAIHRSSSLSSKVVVTKCRNLKEVKQFLRCGNFSGQS
jgi:hypothetical protein